MSQTNGVITATISNNKLNINDNNNNNNNNNNVDSALDVLQNLLTLAPVLKQNLILMSQQLTQF
ncbi:unnamed protein product, partial [Rotaria magnacalcarata]